MMGTPMNGITQGVLFLEPWDDVIGSQSSQSQFTFLLWGSSGKWMLFSSSTPYDPGS